MPQILLVEDDPFIQDIYQTALEQADFEVKIAEEGDQALRSMEQEKPDLILLDIVLPGMNGWDVLNEIKSDSDLKDVKVFVLSNLNQKDEVDKGKNLGADRYLIKAHYTPSQVVEEIKQEFNYGSNSS